MKAHRLEACCGEEIVAIDKYIRTVSPVAALRALYEMLEDYGPMWYTEEAHDLACAALGEPPAL
jgi:hypothetical protein